MNLSRRHFLVLMHAAAIAWKSVLAGTPEQAENYKISDHWWGMLIDVPKCIGCGNCVRACAAENDVPDGYFRTWVERYHVEDENMTNPEVISPDGGKEGFPAVAKEDAGKYFFVPKMCNHCADSPCTQVCPVGATFVTPDGVVLIDQKYCLGCAYCVQACPYGFLRTLVISMVSLVLAFAGSRWGRITMTRLAYVALAFVAAKLIFEDLRHGHMEFIGGSIFLFAITLIAVPRLVRMGANSRATLQPEMVAAGKR